MGGALNQLPAKPSARDQKTMLFGPGPWVCFNPLADHNGSRVVTRVRYSPWNSGRVIATFACDCGYVYAQSCSITGVRTRRTLRRIGPLLRPAIESCIARGASLRQAARSLGMTPQTLLLQLEKEQLNHPWDDIRPLRPCSRNNGKRDRRKANPKRQDYGARSAHHIGLRDAELQAALETAVHDLLLRRPEVRLTLSKLAHAIGVTNSARIYSFPGTCSRLLQHVETLQEFHARKLKNLVVEQHVTGLPLHKIAKMIASRDTPADIEFVRLGLIQLGRSPTFER